MKPCFGKHFTGDCEAFKAGILDNDCATEEECRRFRWALSRLAHVQIMVIEAVRERLGLSLVELGFISAREPQPIEETFADYRARVRNQEPKP